MTDKVQKIKDWISKEQEGLMDTQGNFEYSEHEGAYHILCNLDAYIDSLQEEPELSHSKVTKISDQEEPVSEDLEKEIKRWEESFKHCPASMGYKETARHFTNWYKQQTIDKAAEWLRNSGIIRDNSGGYERECKIEEFCKAMEG